jgi:DNA-binding HxlR family transcriptional regulator
MPRRTSRPLKVTSKPAGPPPGQGGCAADIPGCAVEDLFKLFGKAHMLDILHYLDVQSQGPRRFVDIQHHLGISPNTLSERLKELVEAGLLSRTAYNEIPPRVDYEATAKTRDLAPVFEALIAWSRQHDLQPLPAASAKAGAKGAA